MPPEVVREAEHKIHRIRLNMRQEQKEIGLGFGVDWRCNAYTDWTPVWLSIRTLIMVAGVDMLACRRHKGHNKLVP